MHRRAAPTRLASATALCALLAACSGGPRNAPREGPASPGTPPTAARGATLTVKGSDTMVILAQKWAEGFTRAHPDTAIQVSGGGTGTGIAALLNGTIDVATASRPLKDSERARLRSSGRGEAVEHRVALDALAVYVSAGSRIEHLDLAQLARIFKGEVTNWRDVGGPDAPIVLYSRENNSGTYAYFKEHVLENADFAASAQTLPGTAAVINAVSHDPNGIGYGGIGYAQGVRVLRIARPGEEAVEPTMENAVSGRYPLARFLFMVTAGEPTGTARELLDWVKGARGQALVENVGFYPLPSDATGHGGS